MKDNMGETYFRMNTVFKCYLPAWMMLGTAAFAMVGKWLSNSGRIPIISARNTIVITVMYRRPALRAPVCHPIQL